MEDLLISALIVLLASILQACTGFGFSVMATPFLLLIHEPHAAIQINIILSLIISVAMLPRIAKEIDRGLLLRLVKGGLIGVPAGILVFLFMEVRLLKLGVSVLILALTLLLILRCTLPQTGRRDHVAGSLSGVLTTSIGMPGPPLLLYLTGTKMDKAVVRSTTLAFFLFIYVVSLVMQIGFGSSSKEVWIAALALSPVTAVGMIVGQVIFPFISASIFRVITYVILSTTGLYLFASSL